MGVYTHTQGNWLSRRGLFLIILILFHGLLFWALKSGFAVKFIQSITPPIIAEIIDEVKPEEPPPPPPEVKMELPPVSVPPVLVDIQLPVEPPPTALTAPITTAPPVPFTPPPPPARQVVKTSAAVSRRPDILDFYPPASINLGEEGVVRVRICYGTNGVVTGDPTVEESSSFRRLDEAAVKYGRQMRFKPATEDGQPIAACAVQPVRFTLKDVR